MGLGHHIFHLRLYSLWVPLHDEQKRDVICDWKCYRNRPIVTKQTIDSGKLEFLFNRTLVMKHYVQFAFILYGLYNGIEKCTN